MTMRVVPQNLKIRIWEAISAAKPLSPINVVQLAELVRRQNPDENVALEDILSLVLAAAQTTGEPIVFDGDERLENEMLCADGKDVRLSGT